MLPGRRRAHVKKAGRLVDVLMRKYREELQGFLNEMKNLMGGAQTVAEREAILGRITSRTGVMRARLEGFRQLTEEFAGQLTGVLDDAALASLRDGVNRAIERMWDIPFPGNPVASEKAAGGTVAELRRGFSRTNVETFEVALGNTPLLAGRVGREALEGISDIVTRSSILRGANSRLAAREIAREWGDPLQGLRLKVDARAKFIARTETPCIQSEVDLRSVGRMGVRRVDVFYSAGAFPCRICPDVADGGPYPIERVPEGGIPFHSDCRCSYGPANNR